MGLDGKEKLKREDSENDASMFCIQQVNNPFIYRVTRHLIACVGLREQRPYKLKTREFLRKIPVEVLGISKTSIGEDVNWTQTRVNAFLLEV